MSSNFLNSPTDRVGVESETLETWRLSHPDGTTDGSDVQITMGAITRTHHHIPTGIPDVPTRTAVVVHGHITTDCGDVDRVREVGDVHIS